MTDRPQKARKRPRLTRADRDRLVEEIARIEAGSAAARPPRRTLPPRPGTPPPDLSDLRHALADDAAEVDYIDPTEAPLPRIVDLWPALPRVALDKRTLARNLVITAARTDPAYAAFDVLRTRLVQAMADHGWTRVAITSPTRGCGKSFAAANLALTLSRYHDTRTALIDADLRHPGLAGYLGLTAPAATGDYLRGQIAAEDWLLAVEPSGLQLGRHLAIGLNARAETYAAELFQSGSTADALARLQQGLRPDVMLFDLPPALDHDDVIAFRPHFDCVLMVVGGGITRASEVREAVRRIGEDRPVVGIVLNMADPGDDLA
ncbi:CpsD/CapB family tyrosine-protein kinase [Wenxinia saemankumensis]|uniref:Chromosome partitioning ATPase, Mrp family, contains Fe-S cluster n=1 Tax=Wenxinia saemankumensis TaxID=1447782 RepID=A0A1M6FZI4_9RHOB|nr:CpsD/CapB family tyrosine-protein kinase [Wenxinia saemankumensis]SHJ03034.1 Chromosome partitioning ATPase, Mrp family, contains Fe-S cluster [Wenxinia saemankumensis]